MQSRISRPVVMMQSSARKLTLKDIRRRGARSMHRWTSISLAKPAEYMGVLLLERRQTERILAFHAHTEMHHPTQKRDSQPAEGDLQMYRESDIMGVDQRNTGKKAQVLHL
ncbi:hypothetical protein TGP89_420910 [Toxoplasma gondii p89]|uniref:Uncharacterized protein n=1 Tax=Toxoplasma gondii p89 TaxID=943119 RepID=A0A086JDP5_TOXGO|nr:hypothetical protein TGP89_420910 [Toxoplasma gondii p89]